MMPQISNIINVKNDCVKYFRQYLYSKKPITIGTENKQLARLIIIGY